MTSVDIYDKTLQNFDSFTKNCENYLSINEKTAENIRSYLKTLYNATKRSEDEDRLPQGDSLPELIVDNFDEEQIWQEIELQNEARLSSLVADVARIVAHKDGFAASVKGSVEEEEEVEGDKVSSVSDSESSQKSEVSDSEDSENEETIEGKAESSTEEISDDKNDSDAEEKRNFKRKSIDAKMKKHRTSIVDDQFFKLSEMEDFLKKQEQEGKSSDGSSDESINMFEESSSNNESDGSDTEQDGQKDFFYSDFFDAVESGKKQSRKKVKPEGNNRLAFGNDDQESENSDEEELTVAANKKNLKLDNSGDSSDDDNSLSDLSLPDTTKTKSSFEKRQERVQKKIQDLEEAAISEKPWQLKGEVSAGNRPQDALLEEALEFDATTRPAPVTTEETTKRLEDIIKQRIKDRSWDDVIRKEKPVEGITEYKKRLVLDQEKSKLSLAQVYEQEYLKQASATDPDAADKPEEIPKEHSEIKTLVDSLFHKLDALCNYHYTPKQIQPEVKIVTNTPAISMEEVAPLATSDATLLAPEEVKAKPHRDVISAAERTDTDKKRERRKKKQKQRFRAREKEKREAVVSKLNPGLGNKYSKEKAIKLLDKVSKDKNVSVIADSALNKSTKSSSAFFAQLQDEVSSNIRGKVQIKKKRKQDSSSLSAKRLKL